MSWREQKLSQGLCGTCGRLPCLEGKTDCQCCRDRRAARQRERYAAAKKSGVELRAAKREKFKELGLCSRCGNREPVAGRLTCKECLDKIHAYHQSLLTEIYQHYGNRCVCCGECNRLFLTIDHVDNDGSVHREKYGSGTPFYKWIKSNGYPDSLQILCYNCNCGRARNGGVCPHKLNQSQ